MTEKIKTQDTNAIVWKACDTFRGVTIYLKQELKSLEVKMIQYSEKLNLQ